jgi:hypothetical protein
MVFDEADEGGSNSTLFDLVNYRSVGYLSQLIHAFTKAHPSSA